MKAKTNAKQVKEEKKEATVVKQPSVKDDITFTLRAMRKTIYRGLRQGIGREMIEILMNADEEISKVMARKALENRIKEFTPDELAFLKKMLAPATMNEEEA